MVREAEAGFTLFVLTAATRLSPTWRISVALPPSVSDAAADDDILQVRLFALLASNEKTQG